MIRQYSWFYGHPGRHHTGKGPRGPLFLLGKGRGGRTQILTRWRAAIHRRCVGGREGFAGIIGGGLSAIHDTPTCMLVSSKLGRSGPRLAHSRTRA